MYLTDVEATVFGVGMNHTMRVPPSTQPVATFGSSFILSSFDFWLTRVGLVKVIVFHAFSVDDIEINTHTHTQLDVYVP